MCSEATTLSSDYIVTLLSDVIFKLRVTHSSKWHLMDSLPFIDSHAHNDRSDAGTYSSRNLAINIVMI